MINFNGGILIMSAVCNHTKVNIVFNYTPENTDILEAEKGTLVGMGPSHKDTKD